MHERHGLRFAALLMLAAACAPAAAQDADDGQAIYEQHCGACHDDGSNGAPALDHVPSWAKRAPAWKHVLRDHATGGFLAMPARGGDPGLSDEAVNRAVDYMVERIRPPKIIDPAAARGRVIYVASCAGCHDDGAWGAPVIGDAEAWAARTLNWHTVLEQHATEGFMHMPARGNELQLFSEDVAAAVAFMGAWARR